MTDERDETTPAAGSPEPYDRLLDHYSRLMNLHYAWMYLNWDQMVMMPRAGAPARSQQQAAIFATRHDQLADERVSEWLEALEGADLTDSQAANVREIRREHERDRDVPTALVEELVETASENQQMWHYAKNNDDFESFAPHLEELRELSRRRAERVDPDRSAYEVLYEDNHPYIPLADLEEIFETLRTEITQLLSEIRDSEVDLARPFDGEFPEADQRALCEAALDFLGYDRSRGRLDTAPHPFMAGTQFDARIATRFNPDDPLDGLTATVHEFGHATYQHGLPQSKYGTPLGSPRRSIHESQSRFWENHVGRTEAFWEAFLPTFTEHLEGTDDLTARELYEAANRVRPENLIRVEADELTYHLHIILRCEIDRQFVEGELSVGEIPTVWNDKMEEYLGVRPETDREGCLQDIHWAQRFACFQSYTLGSVVAAQLDAAVREELDVDALVREADFEPIREWMRENVHRHGRRYETPELIERATGEPLTADYFVDYVREKYERLYDL